MAALLRTLVWGPCFCWAFCLRSPLPSQFCTGSGGKLSLSPLTCPLKQSPQSVFVWSLLKVVTVSEVLVIYLEGVPRQQEWRAGRQKAAREAKPTWGVAVLWAVRAPSHQSLLWRADASQSIPLRNAKGVWAAVHHLLPPVAEGWHSGAHFLHFRQGPVRGNKHLWHIVGRSGAEHWGYKHPGGHWLANLGLLRSIPTDVPEVGGGLMMAKATGTHLWGTWQNGAILVLKAVMLQKSWDINLKLNSRRSYIWKAFDSPKFLMGRLIFVGKLLFPTCGLIPELRISAGFPPLGLSYEIVLITISHNSPPFYL